MIYHITMLSFVLALYIMYLFYFVYALLLLGATFLKHK